MNMAFKRIISLVLTLVLIAGILPQNVFQFVNSVDVGGPESITVSAYPAKIAVGQASTLTVKDNTGAVIENSKITFTSSNTAVATVDGSGFVTGAHSGTAKITATYTGTTTSASVDIVVSAVSKYVISSHSFNIGIDTDGNGEVDYFGGNTITAEDTTRVTEPTFIPNPSTLDVNRYIPFVVTGSYKQTYTGTYQGVPIALNNALWYSNRPGAENWQRIMPMYNASAYAANKKYFETYDYLNLNKTAPWQWVAEKSSTGTYDIQTGTTWIDKDYAQITRGQATFGYDYRWEYITLKLDVPASGNYKIEVDTGKTAGINEVFYMAPTSVEFNGAQTPSNPFFGTDTYKLFNIDLGAGNTTGSTERYLEKGEYYFVVHCCGDTTVATKKSAVGYISSITLTLHQWNEPELFIDNDRMVLGEKVNLAVKQTSSFDENIVLSDVQYVAADNSVVRIEENGDGTALVTAIGEGATTILANYKDANNEPKSASVQVKVGKTLNFNLTSGAFNIGNDTNGDGLIDVTDAGISTNNNWFNENDKNAEHYIPFTTADNSILGYCHARDGVGYMLYPLKGGMGAKENPTFQNPEKTAPWSFVTAANLVNLYQVQSYVYMEYSAIQDGKEPYFVVKLDVSKAGTYNVDVDAYYKRTHNQHYYLIPGSVVDAATTKNEAFWFSSDYELGNIDTASETKGTFTSYKKDNNSDGVKLEENVYYFVVKIDCDGTNQSAAGTIAQFKSVTLTLNEMTGVYIKDKNVKVEEGGELKLDVKAEWSIGDPKVLADGKVAFSYTGYEEYIEVFPDGTIKGKKKTKLNEPAVVTITAEGFSTQINVTVMGDEHVSTSVNSNVTVLPVGDATRVNVKETWTVRGIIDGNIADYTFTSSDESIAFVDAHGNVLGVSEGDVVITATNKNNAIYSAQVPIKVVKASDYSPNWLYTYYFTTNAFNVGNDIDGDGTVDDFGGKEVTLADGKTIKIPQFAENPLTKDRNDYIPYYGSSPDPNTENKVEGEYQSDKSGRVTLNGGLRYRARTGQTFLQPIYTNAGFANNRAYFTTYNYQNSSKTAPWQWTEFNTNKIDAGNTYLTQSYTWIHFGNNGITDGAEAYVTLKLNVVESGEYTVSVDSGVKSGGVNMHFYLMPVSDVTNADRATLTDPTKEYGNLDLTKKVDNGTITATFEKKLQVSEPGEYYLVVKIDDDVADSAATQGVFAYLKSVTLVKDKLVGLTVNPEEIALQKDETDQITVQENWSISGNKPTSMSVKFESEDPTIATVDPATGVVTAVADTDNGPKTTNIIVTMGPVTAKVPVTVTKNLLADMFIANTAVEFESGKFYTLQVKENWTVTGEKDGVATDYIFSSSNQNVANVDVNGVVTGISRGNVTITATHKIDPTKTDSIDLYVLTAQPSGDAVEIVYNIISNSYNIGNDSDGDGIVDDFGDNADVANGLILKSMYNTWTDKTADYFIPYYATDANDKNPTIPAATNNNGYAHARAREYAWRLYPIWTSSKYNRNEPYFNQYRYQNGANTGYWQWTEYNSNVNPDQTYLLNKHTMIRSSSNDIIDGKEPYVTLKLMVPVAGTYHFSMQTKSGGASNLHMYMIPVDEVPEVKRENLVDEYKVATIDNRFATTVKNNNAFTADKAGEYYLVIKMDNDNWQKGEAGYPTKAEQWDVRLVSITLTLDKQVGLSATTDKEKLRPGAKANLSVYDVWKFDGNKYIKDLSTVTFTSENEAIAKVDANGVITGVGDGKVKITASKGGFSTSVEITVYGDAKMKSIKLTNPQKWVNILRTSQLKVEEEWSFTGFETVTDIPSMIEFTSSDEKIATVDANGKVTGVSTGKVTITAKHKVSGLTTTLEIEVSGVLEYVFKTTSFNIANYDVNTEKYDFGDETTVSDVEREIILGTRGTTDGYDSNNMSYITWTDKTADKFVPFYVTDYTGEQSSDNQASWKKGYVWGRGRNGIWTIVPFYNTYPENEYFVNSYDYLNQNLTAPWQWVEYNSGLRVNEYSYIGSPFTWVEFAPHFKDGSEPYLTFKIQVPVAGLYTVDALFASAGPQSPNVYSYLIPTSKVSEINRDVLLDEYLVGDPINMTVYSSMKYNGAINVEEPGEYYYVLKFDDDHMPENYSFPASNPNFNIRISGLTLTPDSYTGIELKAPTKELEVGWYVNASVNTTWKAGGKDAVTDLKNEIQFVSSDPSVASVDENGKIVGLKPGTTTITATEIATGTKDSFEIVVNAKGEGKQDVYIYFSNVNPDKKLKDVSIEDEGWAFNYDISSTYASTYSSIHSSYGVELACRSPKNNAAIDVYVRHDGYYQIKITATHIQNNTKYADLYVDGTYVGDVVFNGLDYSVCLAETLRAVYLETGVHTFNLVTRENSGLSSPDNYNTMVVRDLTLKAIDGMPDIQSVVGDDLFMSVGATKVPSITITTSDEFVYNTTVPCEIILDKAKHTGPYVDSIFDVTYKVISGEDVVKVNELGQIVSRKEGSARILATIKYYDRDKVIDTREVEIPVLVSETGADPKEKELSKVEIVGSWYEALGAYNQPVFSISLGRSNTYYVKGINALGEEMKLTDATYSWTIKDTNIVTTEADAESSLTVTAKALGKVTIELTVTLGEFKASTSFEVTVKEGKTGRTVYTDKMIDTALYNISQYDWASSSKENAVGRALRFIGFKDFSLDVVWDMVTSAGLPRTMTVGQNSDPKNYTCRYCNANLYTDYGLYCYPTDPLNHRWKVICPECDHKFPTNDFGSFYNLGRSVENNGKFDRMTALENHREMLIQKGLLGKEALVMESPGVDGSPQWKMYYGYGVKGGYLYNETCSNMATDEGFKGAFSEWETVEGWGVDDGFGYYTGRNLPNGKPEFYPYAAYYNHIGLWFSPKDYMIVGTITACADAYMYTGDVTYGRIAAIMLDRVADVYPEMRTYATPNSEGVLVTNRYVKYYNPNNYTLAYDNNDGLTNRGHVIGRIWGCLMAEQLPTAYDKVYPMYDDPVVIDFLNDKAQQWGYGDAKDSAEKLRENIEMNLLYETYEACKQGLIYGNFGLHQAVVAGAAAVLDTYPYTQDMINWLYQSDLSDPSKRNVTGGDINKRLVDYVWRDGQNYESPYYNEMGISDFSDAAWYLQVYNEFEGDSIYENPKYLQLINSFQTMTAIRRGVNTTGDAGSIFNFVKYPSVAGLREAFQFLKDDEELRPAVVKIAQHLYYLSGGVINQSRYDLFTEDPESYATDLQEFIDEYGEYDYDQSSILTGYGFAYLRDGTLYDRAAREGKLLDTTRDFELNFSGHWGHNHEDLLDLQMNAFGIPMTGDFGYPEGFTGAGGYSDQFLYKPIAHNTVIVNEMGQQRTQNAGIPLHFDANDIRVKVMDAEAPEAYSITDNYRRTVVMIDFNDDISYGVDFFRVTGGDDHLYSFMPSSQEQPIVSDNLAAVLVTQKTGSYAGEDVPFGDDPNTGKKRLKFPSGYTWIFDIDKTLDSGLEEFWMDYQITDFREVSRNDSEDGKVRIDARLRVTMLNNFPADEIFLGSVMPQSQKQNEKIEHLEKFFVRHKGYDIDSLFTAVYEPYEEGKKYISAIDSNVLDVTVADGTPGERDVVKAVRVKIDDGADYVRYDYVVYSSNNDITYKVTDPERGISFSCRGFVGVYSTDNAGKNIYTYVNDGDYIGTPDDVESIHDHREVTGKVVDWQRELSVSNYIDVTFDEPLAEALVNKLAKRMVSVERHKPGNSCFYIEGVEYELNADGLVEAARLDIGTVTTIDSYVDARDFTKGYVYDVFEDASFTIKMAYEGGALADYTALYAELDLAETLNKSDYTIDSWLRYQIALQKGLDISKELRRIDQNLVDEVVAEIQRFRDELVLKTKNETTKPSKPTKPTKPSKPAKPARADYTALDEEIAMMDYVDPALYTIESWDAYVAVWTEAVELSRDLTVDDQQIIDDMTEKLIAAREALALRTSADYTLLIIALCAAFVVAAITTTVIIIVVKRRKKKKAAEIPAEEVPAKE